MCEMRFILSVEQNVRTLYHTFHLKLILLLFLLIQISLDPITVYRFYKKVDQYFHLHANYIKSFKNNYV